MKNANDRAMLAGKTLFCAGVLIALALLATGCFTTFGMDTPPPPSSAGLYPDAPTDRPVGTSRGHVMISRSFNFTHDEVMDAAANAILRLGLTSEESSSEGGKINGSGWWPRSCNPAVAAYTSSTWVLWIEAVSPEVTKVAARLDAHGYACHSQQHLQVSVQEFHTEIAKVLSTY